jgi:hypothetical protein
MIALTKIVRICLKISRLLKIKYIKKQSTVNDRYIHYFIELSYQNCSDTELSYNLTNIIGDEISKKNTKRIVLWENI